MPGPARAATAKLPIGKKQIEVLTSWLGTAGAYGATSSALVVYLTDWRVIVDYIPFYNTKFPKQE